MNLRVLRLVLIMIAGLSHLGEPAVALAALKPEPVVAKEPLIKVLLSEGVFQGEVSCTTGSVTLAWRDGRVTVASPVSFSATGDGLQIGDRVFDESVAIRATEGAMQIGQRIHEGWVVWIPGTPYEGGWKMIEQLPLERYLLGVVSKEMSASTFPAAALEAQAVAARTYTYFHYLTGGASRDYHVYGDTRSQAYGGTAKVPRQVIEAVENTRGLMLLNSGKIFESFYHSTCGGRTCAVEDFFIISGVYTLESVSCEGCAGSRFFRWQQSVKQAKVRRALEDICEGTGVKVGHIEQLIAVETADSGHIPYIRVVHSLGSFEVDTRRLRTRLKLRSIVFQVQSDGENFIFDGQGWGHGIGMCQMGARGYARRNANRTWILQHYYPGVQIARLW